MSHLMARPAQSNNSRRFAYEMRLMGGGCVEDLKRAMVDGVGRGVKRKNIVGDKISVVLKLSI